MLTRLLCPAERKKSYKTKFWCEGYQILSERHGQRCLRRVGFFYFRANSGGLVTQPATQHAYDWFVSGLRSYDNFKGGMPRTWKRRPSARPETARAVRATRILPQERFPHPNLGAPGVESYPLAGEPVQMISKPRPLSSQRPKSATCLMQQSRVDALSQPRWREVPFHRLVLQADRAEILRRKHTYQNRLFNYV